MTRPKFDTLWPGTRDWPYEPQNGVGMHLVGLPHDEELFLRTLSTYSCHPKAGQRILDHIKADGQTQVTISSHFDFNQLAIMFVSFGMQMTICAPQKDWRPRFSDGAYPEGYGQDALKASPSTTEG